MAAFCCNFNPFLHPARFCETRTAVLQNPDEVTLFSSSSLALSPNSRKECQQASHTANNTAKCQQQPLYASA